MGVRRKEFGPSALCRVPKIMGIKFHLEPRVGRMGAPKIRREGSLLPSHLRDSAKERGHKSYGFVRFVGAILVESSLRHESPLHWRYAS
jgi:hypothetical protein